MSRRGKQASGYKHGHTHMRKNGTVHRSPTYISWQSMCSRCEQDSHPWFHAYGGRGIAISPRWRGKDGFKNFLADMGERPAGLTLERKDVEGDYRKGNCEWADLSTQRLNQRALPSLSKPARSSRKNPKRKPKVQKRKQPRTIRAPARDVVDQSNRSMRL